jgi:Xaa-Pro aminopeptidase
MLYVNPARKRLVEKLKRMHPKLQLQDTRNQLASLRVIKQPEEVAVIQKAVNITAGTLTALSDAPGRYKHEFELEAAITSEFRRRGAAGHAYTPIVASGSHATTLHYVDNSDILQKDGLIVVDVGAEVENYAADITRTLCFGSPTARQQSVIDAVKDVQDHALSLLKPGASMRDYERNVVSVMGEALVRLGLITNPNDMAAIRHYYPHATSHFLGLDVHDVGDYSQELRAGMVLTCEPGIYIPEEGIGVRIEDDVLITDSGHTNLSADCSRECFRV